MGALRALVVDDSPTLRSHVAEALQRIPQLVCVQAQDGAEGLRLFQAAHFDLVFTDLHMPVMDGLKLIHAIRTSAVRAGARGSASGRAHPERVPIVVVSTASAEVDRQRALALGATAYLVKPVGARAVEQTARTLLGLP